MSEQKAKTCWPSVCVGNDSQLPPHWYLTHQTHHSPRRRRRRMSRPDRRDSTRPPGRTSSHSYSARRRRSHRRGLYGCRRRRCDRGPASRCRCSCRSDHPPCSSARLLHQTQALKSVNIPFYLEMENIWRKSNSFLTITKKKMMFLDRSVQKQNKNLLFMMFYFNGSLKLC